MNTIRQLLRSATADAHEQLDTGMAGLDLSDQADYACFLAVQLAAREPIESWIAANCPAPMRPPQQASLISRDLACLGHLSRPSSALTFTAPIEGALGLAWALAGSSLGNRAMLAGLRKRGADGPVAFLADDAMPAFFASLRPTIEQPAEGWAERDASVEAARAVFSTFTTALTRETMKHAA